MLSAGIPINVIPVSSLDSFNQLVYPDQNPGLQSYFYNQVYQINQSLTNFGQQFMDANKALYEKINDSEAIRIAKMALRYAKGLAHPNMIVALVDLDSFRAASPVNQRYVMANPTVRDLYHRQLIDGYSDTYEDMQPGQVGDQHYDYRRVMHAVVQDTQDDQGNYDWVAKQYYEELISGDRVLTATEKFDILKTWDVIELFLKSGQQDPTSIFDTKIG